MVYCAKLQCWQETSCYYCERCENDFNNVMAECGVNCDDLIDIGYVLIECAFNMGVKLTPKVFLLLGYFLDYTEYGLAAWKSSLSSTYERFEGLKCITLPQFCEYAAKIVVAFNLRTNSCFATLQDIPALLVIEEDMDIMKTCYTHLKNIYNFKIKLERAVHEAKNVLSDKELMLIMINLCVMEHKNIPFPQDISTKFVQDLLLNPVTLKDLEDLNLSPEVFSTVKQHLEL